MATTKLGLPTITGNMTADVVRDVNALAEAVDTSTASQSDLDGLSEEVNAHLADYEQYQITVNNTYAKKQQPTLNLITLQNGWLHEDYNGLIYRKNEIGEIELDGKIYNGNTTGNTTIGQIPLELLPAGRQIMLKVMGFDSGGGIIPVYLWIHANTREIKFYGSGQPSLCFDGVTIREGR